LVFAGIPTWGYLWPISCPFIMISKMGKSGRGRSPKNQTKNSWMQWSKPRSMEGHPFKYPHSNSQSWMSLLYGCKELLHLISWMGNPKAIRLWISYWRVILWSLCGPRGEASRKDGDWGNDISCSRADQYGRKLRLSDFCLVEILVSFPSMDKKAKAWYLLFPSSLAASLDTQKESTPTIRWLAWWKLKWGVRGWRDFLVSQTYKANRRNSSRVF